MIYKEELRKSETELTKLNKVYRSEVKELSDQLEYLKEQIAAQETMMQKMVDYVSLLESHIDQFQDRLKLDDERNENGCY
ncbi:MAG: putative nucleic acid-binding Zn-ribbon protein [Cyclobacteriaceae bacterium]|jgi:predicted  nucleic acid-binding Zn-ribbon protein